MAFTGTKNWYTSNGHYSSVAAWAATTAFTVGQLVRQNAAPTAGNERVFMCVVAGTSGGAEPTWTVTRGAKNTDGTVTWQEVTGIAAMNGDLANTPNWTTVKNTAITLGHVITDNAGTHVFICDVAGTAGNGAEPTWNTGSLGLTTADNTVTWRYVGTSFSNWAAPHARINNALATNWGDTGVRFFCGSDHAESQASAFTLTNRGTAAAPIELYSVNPAGSVPPTNSDLQSGAKITATGANALTLQGAFSMCYGFIFEAANGGTGSVNLVVSNNGLEKHYESCAFRSMSSTGSGQIDLALGRVRLKNCTVRFGAVGQGISVGGNAYFEGCSIEAGGTLPTTLFNTLNRSASLTVCRGCDWSAFTSGTLANISPSNTANGAQEFHFEDCKIASGVTLANATSQGFEIPHITYSRVGSAAGNVLSGVYDAQGTTLMDTGIARHGGFSSPEAVQAAWQMKSTSGPVAWFRETRSLKLGAYNSKTATNVTATIYGVIDGASILTNNDVFAQFQYLGASANPQATIVNTRTASPLVAASNLTTDTSDWDDVLAARANTHAYVTGDRIALASNPGRVFFCTTGGTSAGSEPAGYATAVDGGSVTDGGATFRAGVRFKITVTFSSPQPAQAGHIYAYVGLGKASTTVYIDPFLELT